VGVQGADEAVEGLNRAGHAETHSPERVSFYVYLDLRSYRLYLTAL